jgi:hypothetical protein
MEVALGAAFAREEEMRKKCASISSIVFPATIDPARTAPTDVPTIKSKQSRIGRPQEISM